MSDLIISIKEARKLLGKEYDHMTDEQVEDLIIQLDEIARLSIRQFIERYKETDAAVE
jgi:Ca2+-binding EF-hand superfamily protein